MIIPTYAPYYLGAGSAELHPSGEVIEGNNETGVPAPNSGAEQDPGAVDILAHLSETWFDRNKGYIIATGIFAIGGICLWAAIREED